MGETTAAELARALSLEEGGQFWAGGGTVTHNRGGKMAYYVHVGQMERIKECRAVAADLGLTGYGWTAGSVARAVLKWIGPAHPTRQCTREALSGLAYGLHLCEPGSYTGQKLVDLTAAFWQAVERLPSPRVTWIAGKPIWHPLTREEAARWTAAKAALAPCKPLRNVLVGCMIGGGAAAVCYCRGERLQMVKRPGPFAGAGMTVSRAVYELTLLQARAEGAVYANTDNLILPEHSPLTIWSRYGYPYREQARGSAEVYRIGCYRVGNASTYWYDVGSRLTVPYPNPMQPAHYTLDCWH